jgi:hypothetical protein
MVLARNCKLSISKWFLTGRTLVYEDVLPGSSDDTRSNSEALILHNLELFYVSGTGVKEPDWTTKCECRTNKHFICQEQCLHIMSKIRNSKRLYDRYASGTFIDLEYVLVSKIDLWVKIDAQHPECLIQRNQFAIQEYLRVGVILTLIQGK